MAGANDVDPGNLGNAQSSNGDADRVGSNGDGDDRALQPSRRSAQIVPMSDNEAWKDIDGWPYQVSNYGRVRRVNIITPIKTAKTYNRVSLSRGRNNEKRGSGVERAFFVHRLVAEAFIGPCPDGKSHVAHRDGNPQNNTPENLYWATPKENAAARISDDDARIMRAWRHIAGDTIAAIARRFMVTETVVRNVVKGRTYQSAGGYGI